MARGSWERPRGGAAGSAHSMTAEFAERVEALQRMARNAGLPYSSVLSRAEEIVSEISIPRGEVSVDAIVCRGRLNGTGQRFCNKSEISFISDPTVIKRYGRFNRPSNAMFYCSSDWSTAFREATLDVLERNHTIEGSVTVGIWRVHRTIPRIAAVLTSDEWTLELSGVDGVGQVIREYVEQGQPVFSNTGRENLGLLATLMRMRAADHLAYRSSCATFEAIAGKSPINGLLYPSVLADCPGSNCVLTPEVVDSHLELVDVVRIDFKKRGSDVSRRIKRCDVLHANKVFAFFD